MNAGALEQIIRTIVREEIAAVLGRETAPQIDDAALRERVLERASRMRRRAR